MEKRPQTLRIFVCEVFQVNEPQQKLIQETKGKPYLAREKFSSVLEILFAGVQALSRPPTTIKLSALVKTAL